MKYDETKPLLSQHIPKCAGQSFRKVLSDWFGDKLYFHYIREKKGSTPVIHALPAGSCVHGHFNWRRGVGIESSYPTVTQRIMVLRSPLEIAISNFHYASRLKGDAVNYREGKLFEGPFGTLDTYLGNAKSFIFNFLPEDVNSENYQERLEEYFLFIGVTEQIQESVSLLAHILKKPVIQVETINASPRREKPSEEAAARFMQNNSLAMLIYDYAVQRLTAERRSLGLDKAACATE